MKVSRLMVAAVACLCVSGAAMADSYMVMGSTSFQSALQPASVVSVPKFDDMGGSLTLTGVLVQFFHDGAVELQGDNDDPFDHGQQLFVQGQMIRSWSVAGPAGLNSGATKIVNTALVPLAPDDGDGGNNDVFDASAPDGHDFGLVSYATLTVSHPGQPLGGYTGAGTADFTFTPDVISQTLNFGPYVPDAWQLMVENPILNLKVKVTYEYTPEPSTLSLLGLGVVALIRRKR
ncbi:MAG: PEP-CTERM sorting domain-containing protein [Planctomycetes bacterium]|nr:PEP-CTERM sorting domain-containing protein [Planctomycetota bacterium]